MTRARVVWASSEAFAAAAAHVIEAALRQARDPLLTVRAVADMRDLMARERPAESFWDMKLNEGGLVDIEFCAQHLQLLHAASGGPLHQNTAEALGALQTEGFAPPGQMEPLRQAWRLQQTLDHLLKVAVDDAADPSAETAGLRALLIGAAGVRGMAALKTAVRRARRSARAVFEALIADPARPSPVTPSRRRRPSGA